MWAGERRDADAIIARNGLPQISDEGAIEKIVDDAIAANPAIVAEYQAGKEKAFNSLVGKVMAASKGKANPAQVNADLEEEAREELMGRQSTVPNRQLATFSGGGQYHCRQ